MPTTPDRAEATRILAELWDIVLNDEASTAPAVIHQMVNANEVGIRFCLPTQGVNAIIP